MVRVVLGAADAETLGWRIGTNLCCAVKWGGVCPALRGPQGSNLPPPRCDAIHATVLDAHTGEFGVSGT